MTGPDAVTSAGPGDEGRDLLRQMVRQVLHELLPQTTAGLGALGAPSAVVTITTDAELQAFAERIATACANPEERAAIAGGRRRFTLARTAGSAGTARATASESLKSGVATTPSLRIERGAVTERHVREAAETGSALVLGRRAVMTPLARDRARASGVEITKER